MLVYVLNKNGQPLMPCKSSKARKLLKQNKAKIVKREPFTIQLLYGSSGYKQDVTLGVDAGSKHIGLSATTDKKELYAADVQLRNDIVALLSTRKQLRRARRSRLRHRRARFNNRISSKHKGWLAPSIEHKIQCHLKVVEDIHKILPITKIIVETASFDIQKIQGFEASCKERQQDERMNFWNVREYVLFRDNHMCQCCKGKSKDNRLNVHHIESRKTGGNAQNNLVTLCESCHKGYHNGIIKLPESIKRGNSFKDATFMGMMRRVFCDRLKMKYDNVSMTYGYITKNTRIKNNLPKKHYVDARCISGNPNVEPLGYCYYMKKIRCHNRQIHKTKIIKGGNKRVNQAPYLVKGFRLFDKVKYDGEIGFIYARRQRGYFDIRKFNGELIKESAPYKKIKLLNIRNGYIVEKNC